MKKFIKTLFLLLSSIVLALSVSACKNPNGNSGENPDLGVEEGLTLSAYELSMTIGDEYALIPNYNPIEGETATFVSSNPSIAGIDEYGRIQAENVGETTITVSYGTLSKTCKVTVGYNDILPVLTFEETITDDVKVGLGENINLSTYVVFNNVKFTDAVISYEYEDATVGAVEEGIFTPSKIGKTTITITASWRGMENISTLTKTVAVEVISVVEIVVNDGKTDFSMYNLPMLGGNEYHTSLDFVVTARQNGKAVESDKISISITNGEECIEYVNDKLQALKPGVATVKITVVDEFETEYTETLKITVLTAVGDYGEEILFSAHDGKLPIADIFGKEVELCSAVCGSEALDINAEKDGVLGLSATKDGPISKSITVYSDTQAWNLDLLVYSGIIDEPSDLDMFHLGNTREADYRGFSEADTFNGYYVLTKDIDCSGYIFGGGKGENLTNPGGIGVNSMIGVGLTGVFDGNGHSITNLTPSGAGLFAAINGGTLKNVSISSTGSYTANGPFLCAMMRNATLKNVCIDAGAINGYGTLGISKFILGSTLENCVFKAEIANADSFWGGLIRTTDSSFKNCYAISNKPLSGDIPAPEVCDAANCKVENGDDKTNWVEGIKRYVSAETMIQDKANNDLSSFSTTYWDTSLGVPVWRGGFDFTVEDSSGNVLVDTVYLEVGNQLALKICTFGEEYATPTLLVKAGENVIEVNGAGFTALSAGTATLEIAWNAEGKEYKRIVQVKVTLPVQDYTQKLLYSAIDGQFFDLQGNVMTVEDIFGVGATLLNATHTTDALVVSNGRVLGLTTNGKSVVETAVVLYTEEKALKIGVNAYTLIIDEASDLDYFYLGNDRDASTFSAWTSDDVFDGYYVLVKNIDCTGYVFGASKESAGETPCNLLNPGGTGVNNLRNMGLTGTFDGNGYAITNFTSNGAGLFAAVNGGTIKNVSITKCEDEWTFFQSAGSFLATVLRDATVENVYIYTSRTLGYGTYGFARFILGNSVVRNCVIHAVAHTNAGGNTLFVMENTAKFENTYVINQFKLSNEANLDASNCKVEGNSAQTTWLDGVKRYVSVEQMLADKSNNIFDSFISSYWDTTSGMPVWKIKS